MARLGAAVWTWMPPLVALLVGVWVMGLAPRPLVQRVLGVVCLVWGAAEMLQMLPRQRQRPRRLRRGWRYPQGAAVSRGRIPDSRESGSTIPD